MKIAVVTGADNNQKNLTDITFPVNEQYCLKHDYDFYFFDSNVDNITKIDNKSYFARYPYIKNILSNYDWVFWIDGDALFMNFFTKIESFIDESKSIIIDPSFINPFPHIQSGQFILKNSSFSLRFIDEILNRSINAKPGYADNEMMNELFDELYSNNPTLFNNEVKITGRGKKRMAFYDKEIVQYNIYNHQGAPLGEFELNPKGSICCWDDIYTPGDFIYHRSGVDNLVKVMIDGNNIYLAYKFSDKESDLKYHADRVVREYVCKNPKIDSKKWTFTTFFNAIN